MPLTGQKRISIGVHRRLGFLQDIYHLHQHPQRSEDALAVQFCHLLCKRRGYSYPTEGLSTIHFNVLLTVGAEGGGDGPGPDLSFGRLHTAEGKGWQGEVKLCSRLI